MEQIVRLVRPEIYAMRPYSSARTEGSQSAETLLDANENPYPPYPASEAQLGLNRYPEPQPAHLVVRFAEVYGVAPENVFLSRGADEAIDLLVRAFCASGRDSIMVTPPTFVMYETAAQIQGAGVVRLPLRSNGFGLDVDGMLAACGLSGGPRLVFVCSPNNPTANLLDRDDVLRLADELLGRAMVVADELYIDYSGASSLAGVLDLHPNLVVLRSMSKEYSLAGERIGITVAHPEVIGVLGRIMAPYSLSASAIRSVTAAISPAGLEYGRANIRRLVAERKRVATALASLPAVVRVFPSDANFLFVETVDAPGVCTAMEQDGIKIRDRSALLPGAVRISIGTPDQNDQMLRVVEEFGLP